MSLLSTWDRTWTSSPVSPAEGGISTHFSARPSGTDGWNASTALWVRRMEERWQRARLRVCGVLRPDRCWLLFKVRVITNRSLLLDPTSLTSSSDLSPSLHLCVWMRPIIIVLIMALFSSVLLRSALFLRRFSRHVGIKSTIPNITPFKVQPGSGQVKKTNPHWSTVKEISFCPSSLFQWI